uniref:Fucosyltransferase n=1 Tax=Lygus hesperus TaxID=30085 RepID=A0A0A9WE55_LYGHE
MPQERNKTCEKCKCLLTADRKYLAHPHLKAVLFYGSSVDPDDMPPRGSAVWGLFHEESPRNVPLLSHAATLSLFNYSSTFSRHSNLPLTLQFLPSLHLLTSKRFFKTNQEKQNFRSSLGLVMYLQSDCSTPNNRDSYVAELMKYVQVDSYGACLNNRNISIDLKEPLETMMSDSLMELVSQYKFSIAIENAICDDYITEKLWRPLIVGSVPLYIGSPSVKDWLPNSGAVILPVDFKSPEELSKHLLYLDSNEDAYNNYLTHKLEGTVTNLLLKESFIPLWPDDSLGVIDDFECLMCQKIHSSNSEQSIVSTAHYDCPQPTSILSGKHNASNWWHSDYTRSACEATAFRDFIISKNNIHDKFSSNYKSIENC